MNRSPRRYTYLAAALLISLGAALLLFMNLRRNYAYYLTVDEFLGQRPALAGRPSKVAGRLQPGSVRQESLDPLVYRFKIYGAGGEMEVRYAGILPDNMKNDVELVIEGKDQAGLFLAERLLTKCPSKYGVKLPPPVRPEGTR